MRKGRWWIASEALVQMASNFSTTVPDDYKKQRDLGTAPTNS